MRAPIVVMGVSGSGKSTVGAALAQRLRVPFADADDLHPPANVAKMTAGQPLDDDDRYPWLEVIGEWLADHPDGAVMSASALRRKYRDQLRRHCPAVEFVHLTGSPELIAAVEQGGVSVSAAADIAAALPQEVQSKIAALGEPLDFDPTDAKFLGYRGGSRALAHRSAHTARAGLPAKLAGDR